MGRQRKDAAAAVARKWLSLTDAQFNMREICKHLLLLEDHLFHREKQCPDCIVKHLLTVEALADEGQTFAESDPRFGPIAKIAKEWLCHYSDGGEPRALANSARKLRKALIGTCFDPRAAASRVAAVQLARTAHVH